jgi:hypothetical protein
VHHTLSQLLLGGSSRPDRPSGGWMVTWDGRANRIYSHMHSAVLHVTLSIFKPVIKRVYLHIPLSAFIPSRLISQPWYLRIESIGTSASAFSLSDLHSRRDPTQYCLHLSFSTVGIMRRLLHYSLKTCVAHIMRCNRQGVQRTIADLCMKYAELITEPWHC